MTTRAARTASRSSRPAKAGNRGSTAVGAEPCLGSPLMSVAQRHLPRDVTSWQPIGDTAPLLAEAERLLDGPLITYWNSSEGGITQDDADALHALLHDMPRAETIYLCLTSDGGRGEAALTMAAVIRAHCSRLVCHIPRRAMSAATMLALSADQVVLGPGAYLSPVDTSIRHPMGPSNGGDPVGVGQNELSRILDAWRREHPGAHGDNCFQHLYAHIHPMVIGAVARAASLSEMICEQLLAHHMADAERRAAIAHRLVHGYPSHGFPILLPEARAIGIPCAEMDPKLHAAFLALIRGYAEVGRLNRIDRDVDHHRDVAIPAILERVGRMVSYTRDATWEWHADAEEWRGTNRKDSWWVTDAGTQGYPVTFE